MFEDLFGNEPSKSQPIASQSQQMPNIGSLNLYGNQTTNTIQPQLGNITGLNLYGNVPQQPQQNNLLGGLNITMQTGVQQIPSQPQPQPQQQTGGGFNFLGTSSAQKPDTSFLGFGGSTNSSSSSQVIKGYENQQLQIMFNCSKESADTYLIVASFNNKSASAIENLVFQVAFTKHLKIVSNNLTSTSVQPHSTDGAQQKMKLTNSSPGDKSLVMKLKFKLSYSFGGQKVSEEGMISNFPEGF